MKESARKLRKPIHDHTCLIGRGNYPCWEPRCQVPKQIVCDDCDEQEAEAREMDPNPTCRLLVQ
jgi:hypothetical protein